MPTRVNGIGTGYYGTSNLQTFDGVCEHCHRAAKLRNYETRLWFSIFFIPVIPLGRKQILSQCPICTWHRAMPFGEWERIRREAIGESASKWDENRDDPDAALAMHSTLVAFQKRDDAERLAALLLERFADVSRVQFYFGAWYERIGKGAAADECFAGALELDPTSLPAKRAVAIGHIEKGRLAEARALLADFEAPKDTFEPSLFFMLARGHQRQEQHEQALELFRMLMRSSPGMAAQKEFRTAVRQSEKALGLETSLVHTDPFYRTAAFKWAVAALLLIVGIAGSNLYIQTHRSLHVLNGLKVPIVVQVDGAAPVEVSANGRKELTVAEGAHRAGVVQPPGFMQSVDFAVHAGWFDRFFKSPVFLIDPTRSAALVWESTVYRERPANAAAGFDGSLRWHIGQPFTTYPDVDYAFQEFPAELRVKNQHEVTKTRVTVAEIGPVEAMNAVAMEPGRQTDLLSFFESHLRIDPADKILLLIYSGIAGQSQQQGRCRDFLATRLDDRPVLVDWHRAYQEACQARDHDDGLLQRYDRYLAADPGNSTLLYLRGRIETDDAQADAFYERARAADPTNPYPWYAQGYRLRVAGEFAGARKALEEASRLNPDDLMMAHSLLDSRFALGEFDALEGEIRSQLEKTPLNIGLHRQLLEVLVAAGRDARAEEAHAAFVQRANQPPGDVFQLGLKSQLHLHYLRGRFDDFLAGSRQLTDPQTAAQTQFEAALELEQLDNLPASASAIRGGQRGMQDLLFGLAWSGKGDQARAAAARERAITALAAGNRAERQAAEHLRQGATIAAGTAERLTLEPALKAVVLVSLAEFCPEQKPSLLALAGKLNYRRDFPHHFLNRKIAALRGD
ncbi:MAG: BTAD domain-containing putative transcriptional regulator [Deltaproteobacteria bacterium]